MSIYIGKDNTNSNIVHITKGANSEYDLKSGVLDNTVFHSKLALSSYRVVPISPVTYYAYWQIQGYTRGFYWAPVNSWFFGEVPGIGVRSYSIGGADYSYLLNAVNTKSNRIILLDANYKIVSGLSLTNFTSIKKYTSTYGLETTDVRSTGYTLGMIQFQHQPSLPYVYYILVIEDSYYPALIGNTYIDRTGFYINSTDIFSNRNLITTLPTGNSIQVSNELYLSTLPATSGVGLQLVTDPSVQIKVGGFTLFDSAVNSYLPFKPNKMVTFSTSVTFSINNTTMLLYTMKPTDSFCIVGFHHAGSIRYAVLTRSSTAQSLIYISWYTTNNDSVRVDFMYAYSSNGNIYLSTVRAGGSAGTSVYSLTFTIESF